MSVEFVSMTAADLEEVTALEQRIHAFPWTLGNFHDSLAAGHDCWLKRTAGKVSSFAVTMRVVDEMHLLDIGVAPEHQRNGLGGALLGFLCSMAGVAGMTRVLLEVRPSNTTAIAFYRHFDFAEIGRRRGYYPAREGREDAIVMTKQL